LITQRHTLQNKNMFFSTHNLEKLQARDTVQQYLERENLRIDNIDTISTVVKETRRGLVFDTLVPIKSSLMKNCTSMVNDEYILVELYLVKMRFDEYFRSTQNSSRGKTRKRPINDILLLTNKSNNERVGFMITEYEECKTMKNTHALKLICAIKGYGELLLYSYLYFAKAIHQQYGVLELAGHFYNMSGLCAYNKYGFREDLTMKRKDCFNNSGTLPMKVDLNKITYEYLDIVLQSKRDKSKKETLTNYLSSDNSSEPLCNPYFLQNSKKQLPLLNKRIKLHDKFSIKNDPKSMKRQSDNLKKEHFGILKRNLEKISTGTSIRTTRKSRNKSVQDSRSILTRSASRSQSISKKRKRSASNSRSNVPDTTQTKKMRYSLRSSSSRMPTRHNSTVRNWAKRLRKKKIN
jgi:hypothetical protein